MNGENELNSDVLVASNTVNKEYYFGVMCLLRESIHKKKPELWKNKSWFLHRDNAPSHALVVIH